MKGQRVAAIFAAPGMHCFVAASVGSVEFAPYRVYSLAMARWTTRDPLEIVDGPNVYGYVGENPVNGYDPLGLVTESECYANYDKCKRNAAGTFFAYLNGLGIVGVAGTIATVGTVAACLATKNPYVCLAAAGVGLVGLLFILDANRFYKKDLKICENQFENCLNRACD